MSVGMPVTKGDVDSQAGQVTLQLREAFRAVAMFRTWLAATPDADLVAMGYTSGEVATLKSALNDLDQLRTIYEGGAALATAKDFRTFAKLLTGVR